MKKKELVGRTFNHIFRDYHFEKYFQTNAMTKEKCRYFFDIIRVMNVEQVK